MAALEGDHADHVQTRAYKQASVPGAETGVLANEVKLDWGVGKAG